MRHVHGTVDVSTQDCGASGAEGAVGPAKPVRRVSSAAFTRAANRGWSMAWIGRLTEFWDIFQTASPLGVRRAHSRVGKDWAGPPTQRARRREPIRARG